MSLDTEANTETVEVLTPRPYHRTEATLEDDPETSENVEATSSETETESLDPEEKVYRKRYGDLKTHYDKMRNEARETEAKLREELAKTHSEYIPPKTTEEIEAWKTEFPDLAQVVETIAADEARKADKTIQERLDAVATQEELTRQKAAAQRLKELHPDIDEVRANEGFHDWVSKQPKQMQDWLYENTDNAELAARVIDLYKQDNSVSKVDKTDKTKTATKAAAEIVSTKGTHDVDAAEPKKWRESEIGSMKPQEFEKYEAEIDKARLEGRIIYDLSRGE